MTTPKPKLPSFLKSLKNFWNEFKRVKRGVFGLILIVGFTFVAVFGPYMTPYDPLNPRINIYPAGPAPIASELAKPIFYKYLPGGDALSENMKVIEDHRISSIETYGKWKIRTNSSLAAVTYASNEGYDNDGAIKIIYTTTENPPSGATIVSLMYNFTYPFKNPPGRGGFQTHISYKVQGNLSEKTKVKIELFLRRIQGKTPLQNYTWRRYIVEGDSIVYIYPLPTKLPLVFSKPVGWGHRWIWATELWTIDLEYTALSWEQVFPTAGNYTFEVRVTFDDKTTSEKTIEVTLDNMDILIYGEVFGLLGTDGVRGAPRDMLSSLIYGARLSVFLGLAASAISVVIGLFVGLVSGYFGGIIDEVLMRITDILMCLPGLPLILVLIAVLGRSIVTLLIILSFLGWMGFARNIRSMTLSIRERAFIEAAKASGASGMYIVVKHVFPNVITLVYLALALSVPGIVLSEASLSWLGLYDPNIVSWGRVLSEFSNSGIAATSGFLDYWWWVILPGAMISLLTISFILLGYSLDEILNPRLRMRR